MRNDFSHKVGEKYKNKGIGAYRLKLSRTVLQMSPRSVHRRILEAGGEGEDARKACRHFVSAPASSLRQDPHQNNNNNNKTQQLHSGESDGPLTSPPRLFIYFSSVASDKAVR